jgi:hypothetical protein
LEIPQVPSLLTVVVQIEMDLSLDRRDNERRSEDKEVSRKEEKELVQRKHLQRQEDRVTATREMEGGSESSCVTNESVHERSSDRIPKSTDEKNNRKE